MTTGLFVYRRKVSVNGEDRFNDNYINPLNVISFYWSENEDQKQILSVFLTNNYTVTFGETVGKRFTEHMEDFLRFTLGWGKTYTQPNAGTSDRANPNRERHSRKALPAEVVEEDLAPTSADWVEKPI